MRRICEKGFLAFAMLVILGVMLLSLTACTGGAVYETNTHELNEEFSDISINTSTADIVFAPSEDELCRVVCYEEERATHSVLVSDGVLSITVIDTREWYEYIGINFEVPKITVYLPESKYSCLNIDEDTGDIEIPGAFEFESIDLSVSTGDVKCYPSGAKAVKIESDTGDIRVENTTTHSLDLEASTGKVTVSGVTCEGDINVELSTGKTNLSDVTCKNVILSASTGDITLKNVIASETFSIESSTGDVRLDSSDAAEIYIETSTGDVSGTLLSEKVFIIESDTGRVDVPHTVTGGRCEITTDTGDIKISV